MFPDGGATPYLIALPASVPTYLKVDGATLTTAANYCWHPNLSDTPSEEVDLDHATAPEALLRGVGIILARDLSV